MTKSLVQQPETGSFNHGAIMSGRRFDPSTVLDNESSIHGLYLEAGYVWGTLRDEHGGLYSIMRRVPAKMSTDHGSGKQSLGGKLILTASGHGVDQMELRPEPRHAVNSDEIVVTADAESAHLTAPENEHGKSMTLAMSNEWLDYHETDVIDVSGSMTATPLQWFLPGTESSLLYLTQTWTVSGTILGRPVTGFMFWEEAWMKEGARLYIDRDPLHDAEYLTWYSWANQWEDGTAEVGHFLFGNGDFHVGIIGRSDGSVLKANTMNAVVSRADGGYWHDGIEYSINGEKWVCDADPHGRMVGLGQIPNPQQEGWMHRATDATKPHRWMAFGESVPARGERRRW